MTEAVYLGLGAALGYGIGDFLGGVWSRRVGIVPVLLVGQMAGLLVLLFSPALLPGTLVAMDVFWGALAGAASIIGIVLLLRGFQEGRLSVVSPASALAAAGTPLAVDLAVGVDVSTVALFSMFLGLFAIWLFSSGQQDERPGKKSLAAAGLWYGLAAGLAWAVTYLALGQSSEDGGAWPALSAQASVTVGALLVVLWRRERPNVTLSSLAPVGIMGIAGALATLSFLLAVRAGIVSVAAVLASFSPAVTVILAWVFLRETVDARRVLGLVTAIVALTGISLG